MRRVEMGNKHTYLVNQIVKYSQKLDQKGFSANHDGNISVRFEDGLLATPTAVSKGEVVPEIVITLDMQGNKVAGIGKPFSEIKLHLAAYNVRPDIKAVVHAHPPYATARGLLQLPIKPTLPEAIVSIGALIPVAEFAMPGDAANANIIAATVYQSNVFMLPGNGVFAVGDCIEQAYLRLELVEHLAKIEFYARQMGGPMLELAPENINKLVEKNRAAGLAPPQISAIQNDPLSSIDNNAIDLITKLILQKLEN